MPSPARASALALVLVLVACQQAPEATAQTGASSSTAPRRGPEPTGEPGQCRLDASRRTALVAAVERASAAVVSINVASQREARRRSPWDLFFVPERSRMVEGYGTGFVIRPTGVILTNQHVVANAERVVVTLPDGSDLPARVLGEDPLDRHRRAPGGPEGTARGHDRPKHRPHDRRMGHRAR